jgi:hypothetical protein
MSRGFRTSFIVGPTGSTGAAVVRIDGALDALAKVLTGTSTERDPDDVVRGIHFWHRGHQVALVVSVPDDGRLSAEQAAAFRTAWDLIEAAVPAGAGL